MDKNKQTINFRYIIEPVASIWKCVATVFIHTFRYQISLYAFFFCHKRYTFITLSYHSLNYRNSTPASGYVISSFGSCLYFSWIPLDVPLFTLFLLSFLWPSSRVRYKVPGPQKRTDKVSVI